MRITINGEPRDVGDAPPPNLEQFLRTLGLPAERVAVERNGVVVRRTERPACVLADGDVLEVVTLVGGG